MFSGECLQMSIYRGESGNPYSYRGESLQLSWGILRPTAIVGNSYSYRGESLQVSWGILTGSVGNPPYR